MANSVTYNIFGSSENFLKNEVTQVWGNAGYSVNKVESSSVWKVTRDILNGGGRIFGLFGGSSGLRTTRYFYNHIQSVSPINGSYIPDQVQTYAMSGVVSGGSPHLSVQNGLRNGRGYNLKKYYQYSKHRYKNRQWRWQTYRTTNFKGSVSIFKEEEFLQSLDSSLNHRIVDTTYQFNEDGPKYLDWLQKAHGIDTFNNFATPLDLTGKPTAKSKGVTVWSGSKQPTKTLNVILDSVTTDNPNKYPKINTLTHEGQFKEFEILKVFENPYDDEANESNESVEVKNYEIITTVKVTLIKVENKDITTSSGKVTKTFYTYSLEETSNQFTYDKETHYFIDELDNTNYPNFNTYWFSETEKSKLSGKHTSFDSNMFKFYAPIPIKDWFEGKYTWTQVLPKMGQGDGIVRAISEMSNLTSEETSKVEEELTDSSATGARTTSKLRKNHKSADKSKIKLNRKSSSKGREVSKSERSLQRFITQELNRDRKLKFNADRLADIKKHTPSRLKRHLETLSEFVGINYMQHTAGLMSQSHWNGGYGNTNTNQASIYLGAIFSNQTKESHEYWYQWAKRQYALSGKEESFYEWESAVKSANSLNQLPQQVVKYRTTDGTHYGGFSFCFIKKIKIKGRTRKIKRQHRLYDILRGKPITVSSIGQLRNLIEPLNQVANDAFYFNKKSGKEYPIGGEKFSGSGYTESNNPDIAQVFQNYSYTLFCKNSGKGYITCYAVCGLQFHTKMSNRRYWCAAWQDLGNEFSRLRAKYVQKIPKDDIQIKFETETGSRKYRHLNHIYNFGIVPLEYDVIRRMNAISLENFAQRAVLNYSFLFVEHKKKRSGIKYVRPIVTIVGFIVSVILSMFGQYWSWAVFAKVLAISLVVSIAVNIAIKHIILPLLKAIGLKGIVAMIVILIIMIIAMVIAGYMDTSSAPYASETTGKVAKEVGNEVAKEATKETVKETAKGTAQQATQNAFKSTLKEIQTQVTSQLLGNSIEEFLVKSVGYLAQAHQDISKEKTEKLAEELKMSQEQYAQAVSALEDMQEDVKSSMASYNVREVLNSLKNPVKLQNFDVIYTNALADQNVLASPDYLSTFLELKLNLDPYTFDPVKSTDFTFKQLT